MESNDQYFQLGVFIWEAWTIWVTVEVIWVTAVLAGWKTISGKHQVDEFTELHQLHYGSHMTAKHMVADFCMCPRDEVLRGSAEWYSAQ